MYRIEIWMYHSKVDEYKNKDVSKVLEWYKEHYEETYNHDGCTFYLYKSRKILEYEEINKLGFYDYKRENTMYLKLNKEELELLERVSDITTANYEIENDLISFENLIGAIEDLLYELERKEESFEKYKEHIEEHYR